MANKIECYCGGSTKKHNIGDADCFRKFVQSPRRVSCSEDMWFCNGHVITGTTLLEQRLYCSHGENVWSGPKDGLSNNSL